MIKVIVFDLGGVVFISDGVSYEGREKLAKEWDIDSESFQDFWFERKEKLITGKMSEDEYLKELTADKELGLSIEELKQSLRSRNVIDEKMLKILMSLKETYSLFALTNDVKEWVDYRIKEFELNKYFDLIISSSDVGLAKPEKSIYELLIVKTKKNPEEILFIDNRQENLKPAEELGIKTYHFKNSGDFETWLNEKKII